MEVNIGWGNGHTVLETRQGNSREKYTKHKIHKISKILDTSNLKILGCLQTCTAKQIPAQYVPGCHRFIEHGSRSQRFTLNPKLSKMI